MFYFFIYQNKIAVGFLEITFYSLGKVTSLLGEKSVFFCHCFKIFEIFPRLTFAEQDSNLKPGLHISRKDRKHMFANKFFTLSTSALVFT